MNFKLIWGKIKYEAVILTVLTVQAVLTFTRNGGVPTNFLTFYLPDYSLGFISRAFIGSFVRLLTQKVTEKWLNGFILLSFLLVYFILALLLGSLIRRVPADMKPAAVFLVAVFLFTNFSVRVFIQNIGLQDIYMFLFVLLAGLCLINKYAKWLVPFFCFAGAATHYGFVMIFFPLVFTLLLYEIQKAKHKAGAVLLAAASTLTALVSAVYFTVFSTGMIKLGSDSTFSYLQSRANFPVWRYFIDGIYFYKDIYNGQQANGLSGLLDILKETAAESFRLADTATSFLLMLPLFLLFYFIWKSAFRHGSGKTEKAVFLLCMALPLPLLPWFFLSTDTPRFLGEIFVAQFCALFYLMFDRNEAVTLSLKKTEAFFKKYPLLLILLLIFSLSAFYFK